MRRVFDKLSSNRYITKLASAATAVRFARAALTALLAVGITLGATVAVSAEGTRDLYETAKVNYEEVNATTNNWEKNSSRIVFRLEKTESGGVMGPQKFKFYAYEGEVVFLGSSAIPSSGALAVTIIDPNEQKTEFKFDTGANDTNIGQNSTLTGFIPTHDKEAAGPNGVYLPKMDYATGKPVTTKSAGDIEYNGLIYPSKPVGDDGYNPWEYHVQTSGQYTVIFNAPHDTRPASNNSHQLALNEYNFSWDNTNNKTNSKNYIDAWDITVAKVDGVGDDAKYYAQSGRVWATAFTLQTQNRVYGYLYNVTRDGYIWRLGLNGIVPWTTSLYANARGMIGTTTNASLYHSIHEPMSNKTDTTTYKSLRDKNANPDGINILGPDNYTTALDSPYPMFFNYPDSNIPESTVKTKADPQGTATDIRFDGRADGSDDRDVGDATKDNHEGSVGAGGYFQVKTEGATSYRVIIDMTNMFAKNYHVAGTHGGNENVHDEEICLSSPEKCGKDDKDINFVAYVKDSDFIVGKEKPEWFKGDGWYGIFAVKKVQDSVTHEDLYYDRHPKTDSAMKKDDKWDFSSIIEIKKLEGDDLPDELKGKTPDGKGNDIGEYKCLGKIMLGNAVDNEDPDDDRIYWNGRDQYGRILPVGQYFGNTGLGKVYAEAKNGEIHFPISDAEQIPNGLSIWLENPPETVTTVEARSSLYYNNVDKSILRDYTVNMHAIYDYTLKADNSLGEVNNTGKSLSEIDTKGNNAWYWNLPSNLKCNTGRDNQANYPSYSTWQNKKTASVSASGQVIENAKELDWAWNKKSNGTKYKVYSSWSEVPDSTETKIKDGNDGAGGFVVYENHSIDGVASYSGSESSKTLTKIAGKFNLNCGSDHGVVDFWTNVLSSGAVVLDEPVVLTHVADQVIVSGFVYLETETPNKPGETSGDYDTATNDRAIANAKVHAEYYSGNNKGGTKTEYDTHTNTDGIYSIPVDEAKLGPDKLVYITVTYNDPEVSPNVITHRVTTVDKSKNDAKLNPTLTGGVDGHRSKQEHGDAINQCKITISLAPIGKDANGKDITQKVFYATNVGYFAIPYSGVQKSDENDPLMIQKSWDPADKKTSSLNATFTILGFTTDHHEDAVSSTTAAGSGPTETQPPKYTVDADGNVKNGGTVVSAYSSSNQTGYIFKRQHVSVNEAEAGVTKITDLPMYYYPNGTTEANRKDNEKKIYYIVIEEPIGGKAAQPTVKYEADYRDGTQTAPLYYYWHFTNKIEVTSFKETVFLDKDNDGVFDKWLSDDKKEELSKASLSIALSNAGEKQNITYTPSDDEVEWLKAHPDNMFAERCKVSDGYDYTTFTIKIDDVFNLDPDSAVNKNPFVKGDGVIQFDGLPQGEYKVTITFPTDESYNNAFILGDESKYGTESKSVYENITDITAERVGNTVVQTVNLKPLETGKVASTMVGVGSFDEKIGLSDLLTIKKKVTGGEGALPFSGDFKFSLTNSGKDNLKVGSSSVETPHKEHLVADKYSNIDNSSPIANVTQFSAAGSDDNAVAVSDLGTIEFSAAGEFTYTLKEEIPDTKIPGLVYDQSEYEIVFKAVNDTTKNTAEITVESITQTKDSKGDVISGGKTIGSPYNITFTNNYPTGSVKVTNTIEGTSVPENKEFEYTVSIQYESEKLAGTFALACPDTAKTSISDGDKVSLKNGENFTISNLPVGAKVTVTQTPDTMYDTTVTAETHEGLKGTVTVENGEQEIGFTNKHHEGSLSIKKEVKDDNSDNDFEFEFTVTVNGITESKTHTSLATGNAYSGNATLQIDGASGSNLVFKDGTASFKIKKNQTALISGLPDGASYDVSEKANALYETAYSAGQSGNIVKGDTPAELTVTNTYKTNSIKVSKEVKGAEGITLPDGVKNKEFTFTLTVTPQADNKWDPETLETVPSDIALTKVKDADKPTWTFKLSDSKSVEIKGVPVGATYTVVETPDAYYNTMYSIENVNTTSQEIADDPIELTVTNTYKTGSLTVSKKVVHAADSALELPAHAKNQKFDFTLKLTNVDPDWDPEELQTKNDITVTKDTENNAWKFSLSHQQAVEIKGLPAGATYTIAETDIAGDAFIPWAGNPTGGTIVENETSTATGAIAAFTNTYKPEGKLALQVKKTIDGVVKPDNYSDYSFGFTLANAAGADNTGATLPTQTTLTMGKSDFVGGYTQTKSFGDITFNRPGTYKFTVKETAGTYNFDYDESEYTVTVEVKDNNGTLEPTVTYEKDGVSAPAGIEFTNTYKPTAATLALDVTKNIIGDVKPDNYSGYSFGFTLANAADHDNIGAALPSTTTLTMDKGDFDSGYTQTKSFGDITFDRPGEYKFTVQETECSDHFTKDTSVYTVTVTVSEQDNGTLAVTNATYEKDGVPTTDGIVFTNTYKPTPAELTISVNKTIAGENELPNTYNFEFELKNTDSPATTGETKTITINEGNRADKHTVDFTELEFKKPGSYSYTVSETSNITGFTAKPDGPQTVSFEVYEDTDGTLKIQDCKVAGASVEPVGGKVTVNITNTYDPDDAEFTLNINKTIKEVTKLDPEHEYNFVFTLKPEGETPTAPKPEPLTLTSTNGNIVLDGAFDVITYDKAGTYEYTLTEKNLEGFTADHKAYDVKVDVVDNSGKLEIGNYEIVAQDSSEVKIAGNKDNASVPFTNTYKETPAAITISVEKKFEGHVLPEEPFTFTFNLKQTGAPVGFEGDTSKTATFKSDEIEGNSKTVKFPQISYDAAGVYEYTLTEQVNGEDPSKFGFTPSATEHEIIITVKDHDNGYLYIESYEDVVNGKQVVYDKSSLTSKKETVKITNTYAPTPTSYTLGVAKTVAGNELPLNALGEPYKYNFKFTLSKDGVTVGEKTVTASRGNTAIAPFDFDALNFESVGTCTYTLTEEITCEGITASNCGFVAPTEYEVVIEVVDNGGALAIESCTVNGASVDTEKYQIPIVNTYSPTEISVDDAKDPHIVTVKKTLATEKGTSVKFPQQFEFEATVERNGAASTNSGWAGSASTTLKTEGGENGVGSVSVTGLTFKEAGEFTVTLTEKPASAAAYGTVTTDERTLEITYTVEDKGGYLVITDVKYEKDFAFENVYVPAEKSADVKLVKRLINTVTGGDRLGLETTNPNYERFRTLYDGQFEFTLTPAEAYPAEDIALDGEATAEITAHNSMNSIDFGELTFKREGTYVFTVDEVTPTSKLRQVTYDNKVATLTYTVTVDPKSGELLCDSEFSYKLGENPIDVPASHKVPTFTNYYGPHPCTLTITNIVNTDPEGIDVDLNKEFKYHIVLEGSYISPTDAEIATYEYFYEMPMALAALDEGENDVERFSLDFKKTDNDKYEADISVPLGHSVVIEGIPHYGSKYTVTQDLEGAAGYSFVEVHELYHSRAIADDTETDTPTDKTDEKPVGEDQTKESGSFISELDGTEITYINTYTVSAATVEAPEITKVVSGERALNENDSFSFEAVLSAGDAFTSPDGAEFVGADGSGLGSSASASTENGGDTAKLGRIKFTKPGVYILTVSETAPEGSTDRKLNGVIYDDAVYTVTYTVTDENEANVKDGTLKISSEIASGGKTGLEKIVFTNVYTADDTDAVKFDITKLIRPNDVAAMPAGETYSFRIEDENGLGKDTEASITLEKGEASGSAEVNLGAFGDVGEYTFDIYEVSGSTLGMVYDDAHHTVTVKVEDNLMGKLTAAVEIDGKPLSDGDSVPFTNDYHTGSVTVSKTVTGISGDFKKPFKFTVTFFTPSGEKLEGEYPYTVVSSEVGIMPLSLTNTVVESGGTIELTHGQQFTVTGIPDGANFRIEEEQAAGYHTTVNGKEGRLFDGTVNHLTDIHVKYQNRSESAFTFENIGRKTQVFPGDGVPVTAGDVLEYEIVWQNPNTKDAVITVTDKLCDGVEFVEASGDYDYDPETRTVTWTVSARGLENGTLSLKVSVSEGASGDITNSAEISVDGGTPTVADGTPTNPIFALEIEKRQSLNGGEKTASDLAVRSGDTVTYYLTARVVGKEGTVAENVKLSDEYPVGLSLVGDISGGGAYDPDSETVKWNLGDLTVGDEVTLSYTVSVPETAAYAEWVCGAEIFSDAENRTPLVYSEKVRDYTVGDLTVSKAVVSDGEIPNGVKFAFTITLDTDEVLSYTKSDGTVGALSGGKLTVNLSDGESVTVNAIPTGTAYTVSEKPVTNYTSDKPNDTAAGAIKNTAESVLFTNTYSFVERELGGITVTKVVFGDDEDMLRDYHFTLTLSDRTINQKFGDIEFIDGVASFTLKNGESVSAEGIPSNLEYTVAEEEADMFGLTTSSLNGYGLIPVGETVDVIFLNERAEVLTGSLKVSKTVVGTAEDMSRSFDFTVTLGDASISGLYGGMNFNGGVATFSLRSGESISAEGIPAGTAYTVEELGADMGYTTVMSDSGSGVITANSAAEVNFTNTRKTGGLTVRKTVVGDESAMLIPYNFTVTLSDASISGIYGGMNFNGGVAMFSLMSGESVTAENLPAGVGYTVTEAEANLGSITSMTDDCLGVIPENRIANVAFTNAVPTPNSLTVSKTVIGGEADMAYPFSFTAMLYNPDGSPFAGESGGLMFDGVSPAVFTLTNGQSITFRGIPDGARYEIRENVYPEFITEISGAAEGLMTSSGATVSFANTRITGSLSVVNSVSGNAADPNKDFTFHVQLSDPSISGTYGGMTFVGGYAQFTLRHGQSLTAQGLPAGVGYIVTEDDETADGYVTSFSGSESVIAANAESVARFVNTKNIIPPEVGSLTVVNNIIGTTTDEEFFFTLTFDSPAAASEFANIYLPMSDTQTDDSEVTFALRHGESRTFDAIPAGTVYSIKQAENIYYSTTSMNADGVIRNAVNTTAVFNNKWSIGDLSVAVTVQDDSGKILDSDPASFRFRVTLTNPDGTPLQGFGYPSHFAGTDGKPDELVGSDVFMSFNENGVAEFTLENGGRATAFDLPDDLLYSVEAVAEDGRYYSIASGSTSEQRAGVIMTDEAADEEFVYEIATGSFEVTKMLIGYFGEPYADNSQEFTFDIRLMSPNGTPLTAAFAYSGSRSGAVADGVSFVLANGDEITVLNVPVGTRYEITERAINGYECLSGATVEGVVSSEETPIVRYVNRDVRSTPVIPPSTGGSDIPEPTPPDDNPPDSGDDIVVLPATEGSSNSFSEVSFGASDTVSPLRTLLLAAAALLLRSII